MVNGPSIINVDSEGEGEGIKNRLWELIIGTPGGSENRKNESISIMDGA